MRRSGVLNHRGRGQKQIAKRSGGKPKKQAFAAQLHRWKIGAGRQPIMAATGLKRSQRKGAADAETQEAQGSERVAHRGGGSRVRTAAQMRQLRNAALRPGQRSRRRSTKSDI